MAASHRAYTGDWAGARALLENLRQRGGNRDVRLLADLSLAQLRTDDVKAARESAARAYALLKADGHTVTLKLLYALEAAIRGRGVERLRVLGVLVDDAPQVGQRGFTVSVTVETAQRDAVIVAQGGLIGHALYLKGGRVAFAVRHGADEVVEILSPAEVKGSFAVTASLVLHRAGRILPGEPILALTRHA